MSQYNTVQTHHNPAAASALAYAIVSSRKGKSAPKREQKSGRIDRRRIARVAIGDNRVFTRRGAPGPQAIRVTILVDASSSMGGWADRLYGTRRYILAAQTSRNLADATDLLPWVQADVVGFTTGGEGVLMFPIWRTGQPTSDIDAYGDIPMNGTEEGYAIAFAFDEMQEHLKSGEQGLIIIVSDGGPGEPEHVKSVVKACAEQGIPVVSVALTDSAAQPLMYGKENVVKYDANPRKLGRDMAKIIGRVL